MPFHTTLRQRERRTEKRKAGYCRDCSAHEVFTCSRCKECYQKHLVLFKEYMRRRRARFLAVGLCTTCGRRKHRPNRKSCKRCFERYRKAK